MSISICDLVVAFLKLICIQGYIQPTFLYFRQDCQDGDDDAQNHVETDEEVVKCTAAALQVINVWNHPLWRTFPWKGKLTFGSMRTLREKQIHKSTGILNINWAQLICIIFQSNILLNSSHTYPIVNVEEDNHNNREKVEENGASQQCWNNKHTSPTIVQYITLCMLISHTYPPFFTPQWNQ